MVWARLFAALVVGGCVSRFDVPLLDADGRLGGES